MRASRQFAGCLWRFIFAGRIRTSLFASLMFLAVGTGLAQHNAAPRIADGVGGLRHARLRWISTSGLFDTINRNDARAALIVLYDLLAQRRGFVLDSTVDIVDSLAEVRGRLQNHSAEIVMTSIGDYLELEGSGLIMPVLTDARRGHEGARYSQVLLVNPASGATTIAGLRGKNILIVARGGANTGTAWLAVLLGKEKLGRAASFFASVRVLNKAQACILPLFFGTVDACVVDEISLNLAKEMNPQLGRLRVLAKSPPMIEFVLGMPVGTHPYQDELIDAMVSLHEDTRGRQMLMVFKTDRLVKLQPGDLDSARELWRDYYRLPGSPSHRATGLGTAATSNQEDRGKGRP